MWPVPTVAQYDTISPPGQAGMMDMPEDPETTPEVTRGTAERKGERGLVMGVLARSCYGDTICLALGVERYHLISSYPFLYKTM